MDLNQILNFFIIKCLKLYKMSQMNYKNNMNQEKIKLKNKLMKLKKKKFDNIN